MNFGIIAAGEGSRLVEEGVSYPKPLVRLNGEPMIHRLIRIFQENGAERICIIVNEQMTEVQDYLFKLQKSEATELEIVVKTTPSSMHSFYEIGSRLAQYGRFIVTTVDTIFHPEDFSPYVEAYQNSEENVDGMMAVTSYIDDEKPLYVEVMDGDNIKAFLDKPDENHCDLTQFVSGGIYGLGPKAVAILDDCLNRGVSRMRNYQRELISHNLDIRAFDMGKIIDVDHADDIKKAEKFLS